MLFRDSKVRDVDKVDARRMAKQRAPMEWADYVTKSQGPMEEEPSGSSSMRRSRSLPSGVNPIQDPSRRRQVQMNPQETEVYAINDESDPDLLKDKTPTSFSMVGSPTRSDTDLL